MRINYTSTAKRRYAVKYVCSKCGHVNLQAHTVVESVSASTGGFTTQKREQKLNNQMREALGENMNSRMEKIIEEAGEKKYYAAKYRMRCAKCRHIEPWSLFDLDIFKSISYLLAIAAVINGFLLDDGGSLNDDDLACYVLLVAALIGLSYLIKYLRRKHLDKKIRQLPPESLPTIIPIK